MINFNNIGKHSYAWDIIMPYYRFALRDIFFKEHVIIGQENIPPPGTPIFIVANHQNSLNDGLVIVTMFKDYRQPVSLARGDTFKNDTVAKILRFWKVMPTYRLKDSEGKSDLLKNLETFQIAANVLKDGGVIIMFPEAMHQQGRYLTTFKKGVPRVCFEAEAGADFNLNLQILPVNLHYSSVQLFREKTLIEIGKPYTISEFFEIYKTNPNEAYLKFNEKTREVLKSMVLHIEDKEHYEEYDTLREMIRDIRIINNYKRFNYYDEFKEEKKVVAKIDEMKLKEEGKFLNLMSETKQYSNLLHKLNFKDWLVNKKINTFRVVTKSFLMVLLFPVFLFGFINNGIPCISVNRFTRNFKDRVFVGSVRFLLGFLFYPLWFIGICVAASLISKSIIIGISYTILAFLSLFIYYRYRVISVKLLHTWRYYFKRKSDEVQELKNQKNKILSYFS
ncbi:MAG: 1-acyl-sn-glycerol-3-phosphate acyltransferase [Bacteroidales bacterium]|jgi:1-acyl-sn-glycerol-3-phosphate acyltransferase|nr:1-acyl-sn-glycerol-3-phosphate acyltransferase [Bacteroidales bacterium]